MMSLQILLLLAAISCWQADSPAANGTAAEPAGAAGSVQASDSKRSAEGAATPEIALNGFLVAMIDADEAGVRAMALPHPDLSLLWKGQCPPPGQRALMKSMFDAKNFRSLKVGDEVRLPGGKTLVLTADRVNETRQSIAVAHLPIPFIVLKVGKRWKVDASPIIAARKAAARRAQSRPPGP